MKTEYQGIEISYHEGKDVWQFELRGRSRQAETLSKAKEAIDKEPKEKRVAFPRFEAHLLAYNGWERVTVTSVAEERSYGVQFWTTKGKNGDRRKESQSSLYPVNAHNDAIVEKHKAKAAAIEKLEEEKRALLEKMQQAEIPAEFK